MRFFFFKKHKTRVNSSNDKSTLKSEGIRVEETGTKGIANLYTPHKRGQIIFTYPYIGPNEYFSVKRKVLEIGLDTPTMEENASLIHAAWQNPQEKYSKEIIHGFKEYWIWSFTVILYEPKLGAYIQDNPEIIKENRKEYEYETVKVEKPFLLKKLESGDPSVRFVPFGYKIGEQTPKELAKNPFVIALAGEEGAEKLAEVSAKYPNHPCLWSYDSAANRPDLWGFHNIDQPTLRTSALGTLREELEPGLGINHRRLDVDGGPAGRAAWGWGRVFGVIRSGEAQN